MAGKVTEAAVVDQNNKVLGTRDFSTTRQCYQRLSYFIKVPCPMLSRVT